MSTKPLETLKAGLARLKQQIKTCRDVIVEHISGGQTVSDADGTGWTMRGIWLKRNVCLNFWRRPCIMTMDWNG
jgi:hypothetical protein